MRMSALAAILLVSAASAQAAPPATWIVDKPTSSIRFTSSFNGTAFGGIFRSWTADIRFDPANLAASSVTVTIDTGSAATGDADRDQALPTDAFFAAAKFPRATYAAHAFKALGGGRYQAIGTLTLRGVSKPLTLPFTLAVNGPRARMAASLSINRLAFGLGQDEWRKTDVVPAAVGLRIAVNAQKH
ncbi:MAG TPA: YceI family protein [Caulobacteraceae bacterium]